MYKIKFKTIKVVCSVIICDNWIMNGRIKEEHKKKIYVIQPNGLHLWYKSLIKFSCYSKPTVKFIY